MTAPPSKSVMEKVVVRARLENQTTFIPGYQFYQGISHACAEAANEMAESPPCQVFLTTFEDRCGRILSKLKSDTMSENVSVPFSKKEFLEMMELVVTTVPELNEDEQLALKFKFLLAFDTMQKHYCRLR